MLRTTNLHARARLAAIGLSLLAMALLAACGAQATQPTTRLPSTQATPDANAATACSPNVGAAPTSYPGWPGSGQAVASNQDVIPYLVSRDLAVGPNRFLVTIIDNKNNVIAASSIPVELRFFNLAGDPNNALASSAATFIDSGTGKGLYRTMVDFACWGDWGVEVKVTRPSKVDTARIIFDIQASSSTPGIGQAAPPSDSPTATDAAGIAAISTDPSPDPDWYRTTITQAETSGKPTLIVFATPAFCQTATCGPTLQVVKSVAARYKGNLNTIHVEPYVLQKTDAGLQPVLDDKGHLQTVAAADTFGLPIEPYTFVLDKQGRVAAKFDGMMGQDELTAALDAVTGP
jgi:hypothetical protein